MTDQQDKLSIQEPTASDQSSSGKQKPGRKSKPKRRRYVLRTPYPLVNPLSSVRFTLDNEVEHDEDRWITSQVEAGIIEVL